MITNFADLPLEKRAQVEEMASDMLHAIVNGIDPKYELKQLPMVFLASKFIEDNGFVEIVGGTPKSVNAGFSYCQLTNKGADYLKHTSQG